MALRFVFHPVVFAPLAERSACVAVEAVSDNDPAKPREECGSFDVVVDFHAVDREELRQVISGAYMHAAMIIAHSARGHESTNDGSSNEVLKVLSLRGYVYMHCYAQFAFKASLITPQTHAWCDSIAQYLRPNRNTISGLLWVGGGGG
jgi:hypothetical protein